MAGDSPLFLDRNLRFLKVSVMDIGLRRSEADEALLERFNRTMRGFIPPNNPGLVGIFLQGLLSEARQKLLIPSSVKPHVVLTYPGDWKAEDITNFKLEAESGIGDHVCPSCGIFYQSEQEAAVYGILWRYHEELDSIRKVCMVLRDTISSRQRWLQSMADLPIERPIHHRR
jgi:hypothetical protein